jgi:iron complex transport system permease protein
VADDYSFGPDEGSARARARARSAAPGDAGARVPGAAEARAAEKDGASDGMGAGGAGVPGGPGGPGAAGMGGGRGGRGSKTPAHLDRGEGAILGSAQTDAGPDYTYRRLRPHRRDDVNPYADARDEVAGFDRRTVRIGVLAAVLAAVLLCALVLPSGWFSVNMRGTTAAQWMALLQQRVEGLVSLVTFQGGTYGMDYVTYRYLIVAVAGAALSISGAVFQGSLKNALASPSTLGVMTGCNLGRIVYVLFFMNTTFQVSGLQVSQLSSALDAMGTAEYVWSVYGMALCALAGGFAVAATVILVATVAGHGRASSVVMVIAGQVVAAVIGAVVSLVQYYFTETGDSRAELLANLQVESFSNTFRALDLLLVGLPVALCVAVIVAQRSKLNLLAFSEDEARSMGLATQRARWTVVLACTALTGVVVAFCGQVGMVGFMVPHLVRRIVGPDLKYMVPASGLAGAAFLVAAYFFTSLFESGVLASFGVYTSIIGSIVFLVIALRQRGATRGDWTE